MRIFIGIQPDSQLRESLFILSSRLQEQVRGRFTHPDNYHITLWFIGETDELGLSKIRTASAAAAREVPPFPLKMHILSSFQRSCRHILWVGMEDSPFLRTLYRSLERELRMQGFPANNQRYLPHITLARDAIWEEESPLGSLPNDMFQVRDLTVFESCKMNSKQTYIPRYVQELIGTSS